MRPLSRVAGLALVLSGAALAVAGQASANDRAITISCSDHTAGTWEVAVTFSSVEVKPDRPVVVSLGSDSATLTEPGPNGTVTLHQGFGADQRNVDVTWSVVRLDYQNMGVLHLGQPAECREAPTTPPSTEAAPTTPAPPVTEAAPTTTPQTPATNPPPPRVLAAHVEALPQTGGPTMPLLLVGTGTLLGGFVLVRTSRRRAGQAEVHAEI